MAYPQTADVIPVPIPVKGMNTRDPLALMDPNYAPWILNYEPEPQYLRARNGIDLRNDLSTIANFYSIVAIVPFNDAKLYAYCMRSGGGSDIIVDITAPDWQAGRSYLAGEMVRGKTENRIYRCSTAITESDTEPTGATTSNDDDGVWTYVGSATVYTGSFSVGAPITTANLNSRSAFFSASNPIAQCSAIYDGSSWAALGFTWNGSLFDISAGANYRGRAYFVDGKNLYYSTLLAVTGACVRVDLSSVLKDGSNLIWIGTLTDSTNKPTASLLAMGTIQGEVLIYEGDNPESPDWQIVARLKIAPVLNYQPILEIGGDIWVATTVGIISLKKMIEEGGISLESAAITQAISPYWKELVQAAIYDPALQSYGGEAYSTILACSMAFWPEQNKLYAMLSSRIGDDGVFDGREHSTILICNLYSGGWTIIHSDECLNYGHNIIYFRNNICFSCRDTAICAFSETYKDKVLSGAGGYAAIPYALHSAYTDLGNAKKTKQVVCIEPVMKTDFAGSSVTAKVAADFGRKTSTATSQALQDGYQVPTYMTGVSGRHIQYRIEGNTDQTSTDGLELYSMGVGIK